jgi:N-methylhydantoinase A
MLATELRLESIRSHVGETDTLDGHAVQALYAEMECAGTAKMRAWFDGRIETRRSAEMRYGEQIFEIDVPLDDIDLGTHDALVRLKRAFERRHEDLYTYCLPEQQPVLVNARVTTVGLLPKPPVEPAADAGTPSPPIGEREVYLGGWMPASVYAFGALAAEQQIDGPAVIESDTTTVLLRPGDRAITTAQRWLDITIT